MNSLEINQLIKISVIVPVWNDENRINKCIDALESQSLASDQYEIIVVDNGSTDNTFSIISTRKNIITLREDNPGSYSARNLAITIAKGEFFAFTDSDCIVDKDWLKNGLSIAKLNKNSIIAGKIEFFNMENDVESSALNFEQSFSMDQQENAQRGVCVTANWISHRSLIEHFCGFDDRLKSGGDHDLAKKISDHFGKVLYSPTVIVKHPLRNKRELLVKRRRIIGGAWNKNPTVNNFFKIFKNTFKTFLRRVLRSLNNKNLPIRQRLGLTLLLFRIWLAANIELLCLSLGKKASRQ